MLFSLMHSSTYAEPVSPAFPVPTNHTRFQEGLSLLLLCLLLFMILSGHGTASAADTPIEARSWYEIFVRSYQDSDGDRIGDLQGVIARLDDIAWMGFDGIWLMPVMESVSYHKYDVTDYDSVDDEYGTMEDLKALTDACHERGIALILDLPINHTGTAHTWFQTAAQALRSGDLENPYIDYYHFSSQPLSKYTPLDNSGWYYEEQFSGGGMPDLNLDSEAVWSEIRSILSFYLVDIGVDGFRLDAVTSYESGNTDRNVELLSRLRQEADAIRPGAFLVGEAWTNLQEIARYYASGLGAFFLFPISQAEGYLCRSVRARTPASKLAGYLEDIYATLPDVLLAPFLANHDTGRAIGSLQARSRPELAKFAELLLNCVGGATFTYYGEEIGMVGSGDDPNKRLAMYWNDTDMTEQPPGVTQIEYAYPSFDDQRADRNSLLHYVRQVNLLKARWPIIAGGTTSVRYADSYVLVLEKRSEENEILLVFNLSASHDQSWEMPEGYVTAETLSTGDTAPELSGSVLSLPPYSFALLCTDSD